MTHINVYLSPFNFHPSTTRRQRCIGLLVALLSACLTAAGQESYERLVRGGMEALAADSLATAESLFQQAVDAAPSQPSNALVWGYLGAIAARQGRSAQALERYDVATRLAPEHVGLLMERASLLIYMGEERRALADYNAVLLLEPDNTDALLMRAYLHQNARLLRDARADYEHVLRLDPTHERALMGMALVCEADRRPQQAMQTITLCVDLYPNHAAPRALRAGMEMERGLTEAAENDYREAVRLAEADEDATADLRTYLLARARFYSLTHRRRLAREDIRRATDLGATAEEIAGATAGK